jgi:hypothetical protein
MEFELRDATVGDLDACQRIITSKYLYDPQRPDTLRALWSEVITTRSGVFSIVSDTASSRVVHFSVGVFISDERAAGVRACEKPLIVRRFVEEWERGAKPFLNAREIARANAAGGVDILALQYGAESGDAAFEDRVRAGYYEAHRRSLLGWNLRSYAVEAYPRRGRSRNVESFGASLGFRIGEFPTEAVADAGIPADDAPCLWFATREDAMNNPGYAIAVLFGAFSAPRCRFSVSEQDILRFALDGKTDEAIAGMTNLSLAAVKKRFRTIYEKARTGVPSAIGIAVGLSDGARGVETRRRVLRYLASHPEELRPYEPTR